MDNTFVQTGSNDQGITGDRQRWQKPTKRVNETRSEKKQTESHRRKRKREEFDRLGGKDGEEDPQNWYGPKEAFRHIKGKVTKTDRDRQKQGAATRQERQRKSNKGKT